MLVTSEPPQRKFNWRIHHGNDREHGQIVAEVAPWKGLLPRWRFVLPAEYRGVVKWGLGDTNRPDSFKQVEPHKLANGGPVTMVDGPTVVWFGSIDPLSTSESAFIAFTSPPPHYIMFGQAPSPDAPPSSLEGITFDADKIHHHSHERHP